jgi:hypothetical protein
MHDAKAQVNDQQVNGVLGEHHTFYPKHPVRVLKQQPKKKMT